MRLSHETALAQSVHALRGLMGAGLDPIRVRFAHGAPADIRAHRAHFRCAVVFGAPSDEIVLARDVFDEAPPPGNRAVWMYLRAQADAAIAGLAPRPLDARVREAVRDAVAAGASPEMRAIAATVGSSERTLRRELVRHGTSFRVLAEDARKARTRELLENGDGSLLRVAFEAGFADASALTHACRRWLGNAGRREARRELVPRVRAG